MKNHHSRLNGGKIFIFLGGLMMALLLAGQFLPVSAQDLFLIDVLPAERPKALSFGSEDGSVALSIKAGTSTQDVSFKFFRYLPQESVTSTYDLGDLTSAGDLYSIGLSPYVGVDFSTHPKISIKFKSENKLKSLYYLDQATGQFVKLDAKRDTKKDILSFDVPEVEELIFGLFEEPVQTGTASWYVHPRYKKELMAASVDFSFGSKVKVTNLANGKEVIVTIKDYGPDKGIHPDRVIDLGKEAFKKIAKTGAGVINVKIEPYLLTTSTASVIVKK
jgi:hypothetical protein